MRIALISTIKPEPGSGDGMTEYAYQLYSKLKGKADITLLYVTGRSRRNNMADLLYANTLFKGRIRDLSKGDFDLVHITNQEVGFAAKIIRKANKGTKIVSTIHDLTRFKREAHSGKFQGVYNRLVAESVNSAAKYSDYLIFVSSLTRADMAKRFGGRMGGGRAAVISSGIDDRLRRGVPRPKASRPFVVGYLGSLAKHKNVSLLVEAAETLREDQGIRFDIYGTGVMHGLLKRQIASHELSNVKLKGFAPEKDKAKIYAGFDAFVFPSLYEGFGFPILEAQACGLPVILYKGGKIPEETSRYCFKASGAGEMARIIRRLKDGGYSPRLKKRATEYARSFNWGRCAKETFGVYKKCLER